MLIKYSSIVCMWNKWKCIFGIFFRFSYDYVSFFLIVAATCTTYKAEKSSTNSGHGALNFGRSTCLLLRKKQCTRRIWVSAEYGASFETIQNSNWVTFSSSTQLVWQGVNGTVLGQSWGIDMAFVIGKSFFVEKSNRTLFTLLRFATGLIVSILIVHSILSVHYIK